jgi:transposase
MLSFPSSLRVFIALEPCDMRAGINTLHALVASKLAEDARSGAVFAFSNKRRSLLKVLHWDGSGMWLMTKRLEQGTFFWPRSTEPEQTKMELTPQAFHMLTDGIDMHGAKPRAWYERGKRVS